MPGAMPMFGFEATTAPSLAAVKLNFLLGLPPDKSISIVRNHGDYF